MEKMMTEVKLKDVMFDKLNQLEAAFLRQDHLDPAKVDTIKDQLAWMGQMWIAVPESDRKWIQSLTIALEEQWEWK